MSYVRVLIIVLAVISLSLGSIIPAHAGDRDHDGGFFLRMAGGLTGGSTDNSSVPAIFGSGTETWELSGAGVNLEVAIGGMVANNFAIHGTITGFTLIQPDFKVDDNTIGNIDANISMSMIGVGGTYYFMPVNMYFTGTVGIGRLSIEGNGAKATSQGGLAFETALGKEWWVGKNWGLGVAVGFGYHQVPEDELAEDWKGIHVPVRLTATFN